MTGLSSILTQQESGVNFQQLVQKFAEELDAFPPPNSGLEPALRELCAQYSEGPNTPVILSCTNYLWNFPRLDVSRTLCLYYFVEWVLEFISKNNSTASIMLEYHQTLPVVEVHCFLDDSELQGRGQIKEHFLGVSREWLDLWGGSLQVLNLPDNALYLVASLNADTTF